MKLLSKTSLLIITGSIFIFWIGNLVFFRITREVINEHINNELMTQMAGVMTRLNRGETINDLPGNFDQVSVIDTDAAPVRPPVLSDTVLYNASQQKFIAHRALRFSYMAVDGNRDIIIYKSLLSSDALIERITLLSVALLIVFIIMIYILNRYIFTNVWSTFSNSLERLDIYDFNKPGGLVLPVSEITEFDKLNRVLLEMTDRIQSDYRSLKELTANTSHEIQTPLAIIRSKAELLLQSENLSEADLETVNSILNTTGRLSKLNQSLLLIAKIENKQFEDNEEIELREALEKYIDNLDVLINAGEFKVISNLKSCKIRMNHLLLDILISNLLKNAVTHGSKGCDIGVKLDNCVLEISNQGAPLSFSEDQLFKRFIKGSGKEGSTGIGLEIVRKICSYYRIEVGHNYIENLHTFRVDFSKTRTGEMG